MWPVIYMIDSKVTQSGVNVKKIVFLPLDERPCNVAFPQKLFSSETMQILTPPILGDKKTPAAYDDIAGFLRSNCKDAHGLVISTDMLLYGGLVPSRLHTLSSEELAPRLALLQELRTTNPQLVIYAFQCIMRCPTYSQSDEEPDYYAAYGA